MNRYICIHGHFYQPPRENPWLEEVELQDSAYPYHDWNQRIAAECYAPNTASRILDRDRRIIDIVNNYSKFSFNFGPTLLSWIQRHEPDVYAGIIEADRESQKHFSGHGAAIAQCYNHMIMPLANTRDKRTQVAWGIRDFEHHFGRKPEGMWLPETAVDLETLDIMAEHGIKFTILAPRQAKRSRKIGDKRWKDVSGEKIDTRIPYLCTLRSGRTIALFFYNGPVAQDVAFGDLLKNGENFARQLTARFSEQPHSQLIHIATDGETYGHHRPYGDMALSYCLYYIEANNLARITVYGEYLEKHPPVNEVEIFENSSWSCVHGVERWKNNCGCNSGAHPAWNQAWRAPLRAAMDWLRDNLIHIYEERISRHVRDPWAMRDDYIEVIRNRAPENVERFLSRHAGKALAGEEKIHVLQLLEMQRHAMLMYTSCGWFFDEISGIETVQVLQYAARAMQLAKDVANMSLDNTYISLLERAPSNIPGLGNGAGVYEAMVNPSVLNLARVGAHYAVSSLFTEYPETIKIYSYTAESRLYERAEVGKQKLCIGEALIRSDITLEESTLCFAVLHLGDHNLVGGVRTSPEEDTIAAIHEKIKGVFLKSDMSETIRLIEKYFVEHHYSLWHLFRDEQRKVLDQILDATLKEMEGSLRQVNERNYPIIQAMRQMGVPLPKLFTAAVELILNADLLQSLKSPDLDLDGLQKQVEEARKWRLHVDRATLGFVASNRINQLMEKSAQMPEDYGLLKTVQSLVSMVNPLSLDLNLWKTQNIYFSMGKHYYPKIKNNADTGDADAMKWIKCFNSLGNDLRVRIA
jgi:alpha-amylase/alpha-mannosidase (GH57 family)